MNDDCGCYSHNGFLTAKGLAETAQRELEIHVEPEGHTRVSGTGKGSVGGARRDEETLWPTEDLLDEQHRRYLRHEHSEGGGI